MSLWAIHQSFHIIIEEVELFSLTIYMSSFIYYNLRCLCLHSGIKKITFRKLNIVTLICPIVRVLRKLLF